jgi:DNA ligase-1
MVLALSCPAWAQLPPLMLAGRYHADVDPAQYWVSEKLDGVRALWNGRQLLFRSGKPVNAPAWFVQGLPPEPLDGELWIGRGRFEQLVGTVRTHEPDDAAWREVKYMIFDLPAHPGTFTARVAAMERIVNAVRLPWLRFVEQRRVADREALIRAFDRVVSEGGEGLMLHRADALRVAGRTDAILKYVPWLDAEARVVAHIRGKGKYAHMLGALLVETPDGRRFRSGTGFTDAQRRTPPAPGTQVTYRYRELTRKGLPRFPSFLRVRELP